MTNPNSHPSDRFDYEVHVESHRRISGDERPFNALNPIEKLTRVAMIGSIELPEFAQEIRDELTVFQTELDIQGLTES